MIETWVQMPFDPVPKEQRVKTKELAPCKGSCHSLRPIHNTKYQLCSTCSKKYRYYGCECDVPNCKTVADGTIAFQLTPENKLLCTPCERSWKGTFNNCSWERFVEERHLHLVRPPTFVKVKEEGLLPEIPAPQRVKQGDVAECQFCYKHEAIDNMTYQLCSSCRNELQYLGEKCSIKGAEPCESEYQIKFDTQESRFVCNSCNHMKRKYKLSSFQMYEREIRTITECMICQTPVSHNRKEGEKHCSANIDHDHETGEVRGVLCSNCNWVEGRMKASPLSPHTFARRMVSYLEKPPLSKSWMQE